MNLKIHLLVIAILIGGMFAIWQTMFNKPVAPETSQQQQSSDWFVRVSHANYGLNCKSSAYGSKNEDDILPDNVLQRISDLCNGRIGCTFKVTDSVLGVPSSANCRNKELEIEYRCFSYDRPWVINAKSNETVVVDCREKK